MAQVYIPAALRRLVVERASGRCEFRLLQLNHPDRVAERELLIAAGLFSVPA